MLSPEYNTIVLTRTTSTSLTGRVFSSGCSQHVFPQTDFWRTLIVQNQSLILSEIAEHLFYRIGVDLLFSGKEETLGSELANSLLFPKLLILQSGSSIAPYRT